MLRCITNVSLAALLACGAFFSGQSVVAADNQIVPLNHALIGFQPVNNQLPKADPRRYSPPSAMYQNHARDYSRMLYYYGNSPTGVKPAQAQHLAGEIKKNVELSAKELKDLQVAHAADDKVKEAITKIQQHHKNVLQHCQMIDEECQASKLDTIKICDCCVDIESELKAAISETEALLKHLKLDQVPAMRKSTEKAPAR